MDGKQIRLKRIADKKTGRFIIVPMDHGVSFGPIEGIFSMGDTVGKMVAGGATALIMHKGMVDSGLQKCGGEVGLILHLSASTQEGPDPDEKVLVTTVERALRCGADAVSVHVNVGADAEAGMLRDLGKISDSCHEWHVPLLAMLFPRGPKINDPFNLDVVKHASRLGAELGADIIKTNYTGSEESFREVTKGCPVPVVVAGGPKMESDREVLVMVEGAMRAGAAGVAIGRNIFQHDNVTGMTKAIAKIVLENMSAADASKVLTQIVH